MQYQNSQPAEGINISEEHLLKEFVQLLLGVALAIVVIVLLLTFIAGSLARYVPFAFERNMVSGLEISQVEASPEQQYLQSLADRLASKMGLPEDMSITVHYSDSDMVNAFATLGGNLFFFKGLLDTIESEDELAAVMGHEIAHVKYRHPIVALGKGITVAAFAASISGFSGSGAGEWLIGNTANLSLLKFSRDQESAADTASAKGLHQLYGHIGGAHQLFEHFAELEQTIPVDEIPGAESSNSRHNSAMVEIFRSHPYSENRWLQLARLARSRNWPVTGKLTELHLSDNKSP